jgi:hypothetical protein
MTRYCQFPDCKKHPSFKGETTPKFCKEHMKKGMEDVVHPRCQFPACKKIGSYGLEGNKIFCGEHK